MGDQTAQRVIRESAVKTRRKTRRKTLEPAAAAFADLHAKLDTLVRCGSKWMPLIADTINFAYKDMPNSAREGATVLPMS
jgi:hypothetical protein